MKYAQLIGFKPLAFGLALALAACGNSGSSPADGAAASAGQGGDAGGTGGSSGAGGEGGSPGTGGSGGVGGSGGQAQGTEPNPVTEAEYQARVDLIVSRAGGSLTPPSRNLLHNLVGRLHRNPNDSEALQALSTWFDTWPDGDMFNYWPTAYAANKWWPQLSTAQRNNIRDNMSTITDWGEWGTSNHCLMRWVGCVLYAQLWPNDAVFAQGWTGNQWIAEVKPRLMAASKNLYFGASNEHMSPTYLSFHIGPWVALYDQTNDPELKAAADAALRYHITALASSHLYGQHLGPYTRENTSPKSLYETAGGSTQVPVGSQQMCWLFWGDNSRQRVGYSSTITNHVIAASSWRPSAAINRIALGTEPLTSRGSAATHTRYGFSQQGSAYPDNNGVAYRLPTPYDNVPGRFSYTWYREERFALGSAWHNWDPDDFYTQFTGTNIKYNVTGAKGIQAIDISHPYWRMDRQGWQGDFYAFSSPFESTSQHLNTLITLFNIPTNDPWAERGRLDWRDSRRSPLIQAGRLRYPATRDEVVEANGWVFIRDGEVYFAIRPLSSYTINTNTPTGRGPGPFDNSNTHFHVIETPGPRTGFIVDVVTASEFASFAAFRTAVLAQPLTIDLATPSASYQSVRGHTIAANWVPVDYTYTGIPPNVQPGRIRVRNNLIVNGQTVPADETYPVLVNDYVDCQDYQMSVSTPAGDFSVDWTGSLPVITN